MQPAAAPQAAPPPAPAPSPRRAAAAGFQTALAAAGGPVPARPGVALSGTGRPWEGAPNPEFRARIAAAERSTDHPNHGYGAVNPRSGAMGRYQFLPSTLQDLGWRDAAGNWTDTAARHGVTSDAAFLSSASAQEAAFTAFLRRVEQQIERNGALSRQGATLRGLDGAELRLTESGLMAAAHRRGSGMLARYLQHRAETPDAALPARDRRAFQAVERRLRDFEQVAYNSVRTPRVPASPALAALALSPSS